MAREVIVKVTDDLDRSLTATVVREIGFGDYIYILDLTDEHEKELVDDLSKWIDASHDKVKWLKKHKQESLKAAGNSAIPAPSQPVKTTVIDRKEQNRTIRAWARRNGYEVRDRGYIPSEVRDAYEQEHGLG